MPNYPARTRSSGHYSRDVANPIFREAEDRFKAMALSTLGEEAGQLVDARHLTTYYDFAIGPYKYDVKCDSHTYTSGKVAWETQLEDDRRQWPGWGEDRRLTYVVYVQTQNWYCHIVNADVVRQALKRIFDGVDPSPHEDHVSPFTHKAADGRVARGWVLSLDWLREVGALKQEGML